MTKAQITQLSYKIVGASIEVHKTLGPGLLESVYEKCLKYQLEQNGHKVIQQAEVPIFYGDLKVEAALRLDLLIDDVIIVELKAVEKILPIHEAQLLSYMKLLKKPQGLLINFHTTNITKSMKPLVNEYFSALP